MLSIQELENLNAEAYKDSPETLIELSEELIFNKKFEKAIELREKAIQYSIEKNNNDLKHPKCASFYVHYADALIIKIMETQDLFNNPAEAPEEVEQQESENEAGQKKNYNNINLNVTGKGKNFF